MAEYTGTFETGVNGIQPAPADPGSATQWDNVTDTANSTILYSNTQAYQTLSCEIVCDSTGGITYVDWDQTTISPAYAGTHYGRIYGFLPSAPDATVFWVRGLEGASRAWELRITTGMLIQLGDTGGTQRGITTIAANTNAWFRIEWRIVQSTTAGVIEVKLFNDPDSVTPTETVTSTGSFSTLTTTDRFRFGSVATAVPNLLLYMDNIQSNDTDYPGPFSTVVAGNLAPVIYGRGAA